MNRLCDPTPVLETPFWVPPFDAAVKRSCVSMMSGNIAVFGGNGLTGSEVVYQALERGDTVTAFCRDPSKLTVRLGWPICLLLPELFWISSRVVARGVEPRWFLAVYTARSPYLFFCGGLFRRAVDRPAHYKSCRVQGGGR